MPQGIINNGYYHLIGTAAGTQVILNDNGNFNTYTVGTATTGTCTLFDCAAAGGTTAGNRLISYTGALRDSAPNIDVRQGLVAVVSGTIDAVIGQGG